ncbi:hypothetical protein ACFL0D_04115 [Thermoproteota archaeon]
MAVRLGKPIIFVILAVVTVGGITAMGLMQSTERLGTSGLIIRPVETSLLIPESLSPAPSPPPPEPSIEIDIYKDLECTELMSTVDWGEIEAGGTSYLQLYVKNNGDANVIISLQTENWDSQIAENNMELSWDYNGAAIQPEQILPVTLTLSVDEDCPELTNFGFDIVIVGS